MGNPSVEIRLLTHSDLNLVMASDAFDNAASKEQATAFLNDNSHLIVGAVDDDELIGFASGIILLHPDKEPILFISEVGVNDDYLRQGIGGDLVNVLLKAGKDAGCNGAWLATESDNAPARGLYLKSGARATENIVVYDWDGVMDD